MGMADGFAQASGQVGHVNLHTAPGVGNAMGAIFNAQANKSPLLVTAGNQTRSLMTLQANLTNRDATRMPHPLVKWCVRAAAGGGRAARARARDPPGRRCRRAGPVFVSIPMDDWDAEVDDGRRRHQTRRTVDGRAAASPAQRARAGRSGSRMRRTRCSSSGPDVDASGAWDAAIALAEKQRLPVWATPAPGGGRIGFPEDHPAFQGILAAGDRAARRDAPGPRPDPRRRLVGVPVLPEHPRAAAARGRGARGDHERPRRGRARADGRRDRGRRGADARGARWTPSASADRPRARRPSAPRRRRSRRPTR